MHSREPLMLSGRTRKSMPPSSAMSSDAGVGSLVPNTGSQLGLSRTARALTSVHLQQSATARAAPRIATYKVHDGRSGTTSKLARILNWTWPVRHPAHAVETDGGTALPGQMRNEVFYRKTDASETSQALQQPQKRALRLRAVNLGRRRQPSPTLQQRRASGGTHLESRGTPSLPRARYSSFFLRIQSRSLTFFRLPPLALDRSRLRSYVTLSSPSSPSPAGTVCTRFGALSG